MENDATALPGGIPGICITLKGVQVRGLMVESHFIHFATHEKVSKQL